MAKNWNRFSIDDEFTCYFMGLFLADGNMRVDRGYLRVKIASKDEDVIKVIAEETGNRLLVSNSTRYGKVFGKRFSVKLSTKFAEEFKRRMDSYKDFSTWVSTLNEDQIRHFVRGYFDGDGCISYSWHKRDKVFNGKADFSLAGSFEQKFIPEILKEFKGTFSENPGKTMVVRRFSISKYLNVKSLFNYMYQNATIFMARKHSKFLEYFRFKDSSVATV